MKRMLTVLFWAVPIFAQQLSPIQTAVLNDDAAAIEVLASQGVEWLFIRKPEKSSEGELLLDFALANGKTSAYNTLIGRGAQPGITTVFTAVKSRNYILAKQLTETGNLAVYTEAEPVIPRYTISNRIETNISAAFFTNLFTNISQFAVTNAIGELTVREYTNTAQQVATNFFTNVVSKVVTNTLADIQKPPVFSSEPRIDYVTLTNITPSSITNYRDNVYSYKLTNTLGQTTDRIITNVVPEVLDTLATNIIRRPITNASSAALPPAPTGYTLKPVSLSRLNYIDLARLAESQGSKETSLYFLEKARALE